MMPSKKTHQSSNGSSITKDGLENAHKKPVNHWAFLDEIEAPMWVDLNLEHYSYLDRDDDWFHISHQFHQCSSRELILAFSRPGQCCTNLELCVQGPSSPQLPSSVSRSRGEHYGSSREGQRNYKAVVNKENPVKSLSCKFSSVQLGTRKTIKDKPQNEKLKGHVSSELLSVGESTSTVSATFADNGPVSIRTNSAESLTCREGGSSSNSTITCESTKWQPVQISSQVSGSSSALISTLRASLRKSCVTRPASRVVVKEKLSESQKSCSSKSSVGSSSYTGSDGKNPTVEHSNDKTPDSRKDVGFYAAPTCRMSQAYLSKASAAQGRGMFRTSKGLINQEARKAKVQDQSMHRTALLPRRNNEYVAPVTSKTTEARGAGYFDRSMNVSKENNVGRERLGMKSLARVKEAEGHVQVLKVVERKVQQETDRSNFCALREKSCSGNTTKKSTRTGMKIYLR